MDTTLTAQDLRGLDLLDTSDAADRLELSATRVAQLEREGRIPAARTASGRRIFLGADIEAFKRARVQE